MHKVTVEIPNNKLNFFLELFKNHGVDKIEVEETEIAKTPLEKRLQEDFIQAAKEIELHEKGEIEMQSLDDFLDEL